MTKFKEGTWIYDGRNMINLITHINATHDWQDNWKELKTPPNLEVVEPKPVRVRLSEVEPKVGMKICNMYDEEDANPRIIVASSSKEACIQRNDGLFHIIPEVAFGFWEVIEEPAPQKLTVEESPRPEHFGKTGRWSRRDGDYIIDELQACSDTHNTTFKRDYPICVNGTDYTPDGHYYQDREETDCDLVEFHGWENDK